MLLHSSRKNGVIKKSGMIALILSCLMIGSLTACNRTAKKDTPDTDSTKTAQTDGTPSGKDLSEITIAYVPTTMNNPFWSAMMGGIKKQMETLGMDPTSQLVTVDANSDQATMNDYVNDLIAQKVDAVIIAPMDTTAVTEALQVCADAKIPVINVDTPVDAADKVASVIASDNYRAGVLCAEDMMSKLPNSSTFVNTQIANQLFISI